MKKNLVPLLGVALVVAILATGVFYGLFVSALRSGGAPAGPAVVVAVRDLERGSVLTAEDVRLERWSTATPPDGIFSTVEQTHGLVVVETIRKFEPVTPARAVSKEGGGVGIALGMRAISIHPPDPGGVLGILRAGHRVDIQAVSLPGANMELKTIVQNVEVLRVDPVADPRVPPVVTLLVKPREADEVTLADAGARVRLALRNPLDPEQPALPRLTLPPLFQKPAAAARPAGRPAGR